MATPPPRKNPTPTRISRQHLSPLQVLLQMGFPKQRAEKALAATGNKDVQLASDWLLAHVNDPHLDDTSPREYILYVCPTGSFLEQLQQFWEKSMSDCAWNGAHNFIPHITLVSFFKAPDEETPHIINTLKSLMERPGALLDEPLKLETYISPNFMGFFVVEEHEDYLKRIALQYVKEVSNAIVSDTYEHFDAITACFPWCTTTTAHCIPRESRSIKPHVKSLHLSLAYQFPSTDYSPLKTLVDNLDPAASTTWELRLYSRDPRLSGKQVHKVVHPYSPAECDELELRTGDYVYIAPDALASSQDGWVEGTSWLTGQGGLFPHSYTQRTAETDAWTLHEKLPLNTKAQNAGSDVEEAPPMPKIENIYENVLKMKRVGSAETENQDLNEGAVAPPRKLFLMRHGERVDFTFGTWIPYCFDDSGKYIRKDLNMPVSIPERAQGPSGYVKDTPLTNVGIFQAAIVGEAFKDHNITIGHAYCSPSFRCIQTCAAMLKGCGCDDVKIKIEPGLFEWLLWYPDGLPNWMTSGELTAAGYNIDLDYRPFIAEEVLKDSQESCEKFYARSALVANGALDAHPVGNVILVGHAATLDVCSRELIGKTARLANEMTKVIQKVPYCSLLQLREEGGKWEITEPPFPPVTHSTNQRFDYKILL